jgi:hypothetical protein
MRRKRSVMIGVRGDFEFLDGFAHQTILSHQASNTTTANRFTQLSQIMLNALCPIVLATGLKGLNNQCR